MTNQVTNYCGDIKSIAANTDGTPTQKLIAVLRHCGVETTAELAAIIGVGERAIQKANSSSVERTTVREPEFVSEPQFANSSSETNHSSPLARVEDNNINTNPKIITKQTPPLDNLIAAPKKSKAVTGSRLDPDWQPDDDLMAWTRVTFPQTTPERIAAELETFHDYWAGAPGQKGRKADWPATWRNWARRAFATAPLRPRAQDHEKPRSRLLAALDAGVV